MAQQQQQQPGVRVGERDALSLIMMDSFSDCGMTA